MRTTVTLDDDIAIRLERLSQEQGRSFKSVINEALRAGLEAMQRVPTQRAAGEGATYTIGYDLGEPLMGDRLPSRAVADLEEEEDVSRLAGSDVAP